MSLRVLVVAADDAERSAWTVAVRAHGHVVETATSVREGLAALRRSPVDLLLTDLHLPGASGLELVAAARTCRRAIVVTDSPVDGLARLVRRGRRSSRFPLSRPQGASGRGPEVR